MAFFLLNQYYINFTRMKKISVFALALACGSVMYAQEIQPQLRTDREIKTRFGIRAGINSSTVNMSDNASVVDGVVTGANSKTSYNAGAFVNIPIGMSAFRFQPEVNFSSQGARFFGGTGTGYNYEQDFDYLNVPLNFQLMTKKGFFVQTGPQVGLLLSADQKNASGTGAPANGTNTDAFDKVDLAWTAGVGYLSRIGLGVDARYNLGLRNVREDGAPVFMQGNWRNNVAQFTLLYHFGANR